MNKKHFIVLSLFVAPSLAFGVDGLECMALLTAPILAPLFIWMEE